jgi:hypothetical protein
VTLFVYRWGQGDEPSSQPLKEARHLVHKAEVAAQRKLNSLALFEAGVEDASRASA